MLGRLAGRLGMAVQMLVVVVERHFLVVRMVRLMVFVVEKMQVNKIQKTNFFLLATKVVDVMMKKFAELEKGLQAMIGRGGSGQKQHGQKYGQTFFHVEVKIAHFFI